MYQLSNKSLNSNSLKLEYYTKWKLKTYGIISFTNGCTVTTAQKNKIKSKNKEFH